MHPGRRSERAAGAAGVALIGVALCGCFDLGGPPPATDAPVGTDALPGDTGPGTDATSMDCTCNSMCTVDETVAGPIGFADVEPIFSGNCTTTSICHLGGGGGAGEDLTSGGLCASVINMVATQTMGASNMPRITPGDPESSYLYHKLRGTHRTLAMGIGCRMPLGVCCLTPQLIGTIRRWILDGAPCP